MRSFLLFAAFVGGSVQAMLRHEFDFMVREGYNQDSPMENENLIEGDIIGDDGTSSSLLYNAITLDSK